MNTSFTPIRTEPDRSTPSPQPLEQPEVVSIPVNQAPWWWLAFRQPSFYWGFLCVTFSTLLFALFDHYVAQNGFPRNSSVYIAHYLIAVLYTVVLLYSKELRFFKAQPEEGRPARMLALVLWLISAYALNREMPVFQQSVSWLQGMLVLAGILMVGENWLEGLSVRGQQLLIFGLAMVWWLFFYQTIYVGPYYHFGVLGLFILGIGSHIFIPLLITIAIGRILIRSWNDHEHRRPAIVFGLLVPLVITGWFLVKWSRISTQIRYTSNAVLARNDDELPSWVLLAQQLPADWVTERYLKTGSMFSQSGGRMNSIFGRQQELQRHDPLVFMATAFQKPERELTMDVDKLIGMLYTSRHLTEERLWAGTNLRTTNVLTQARIYPEYRLAYTEKTLHVRNGGQTQQEALYTFHLPVGSVVTSLSLWIDGREEKGVLTTKAKADTAYRTIVGVERRDPSVVHWREGNRVTVRVFPCLPYGERQVKIGITSPLRLENRLDGPQQLVYENAWFEGPDTQEATETVKLDFSQKPLHTDLPDFLEPGFFDKPLEKQLLSNADYQSAWEIRFDAPKLSAGGFRFGGNTYAVEPARQTLEAFRPQAVFLDLNQAWTKAEIDEVMNLAQNRPVWVYDEGLVQLTKDNRDELTERLLKQRFSVFPFYRIPDPATALLVTKGSEVGPQLEDLALSPYGESLNRQAENRPALRTFCLSKPSDLVKTLSELGVLQTDYGTISELQTLVKQNRFIQQMATDQSVMLPQAGLLITRTPETVAKPAQAKAPDHLIRLYAYNHLLNQIGRNYFSKNYMKDSLSAEALQANVVSPVSSLIVLETQADYERFGIQKSKDGLANATLKNTGAVPEPHEWALLFLAAIWIFYLWQKGGYVGL
ncbi:XrtN system VIT domain-containing protein [Larkinella rosea]|uniref:XrtN system VIT domain-containing protein n=1 Tax=Larkinella rosea TaxID=2025312 RepID=A0A3P1BTT7_9BACT|nr:XrtN system VIT domain-containing protein [Larkinella rosea]RRB04525.1 XrtN system VIT domain-containing protein [Larkinella rosea]